MREATQDEIVVAAAYRSTDGEVFLGTTHARALEAAMAWGATIAPDDCGGFWTSRRRYVTRAEASHLTVAPLTMPPEHNPGSVSGSWDGTCQTDAPVHEDTARLDWMETNGWAEIVDVEKGVQVAEVYTPENAGGLSLRAVIDAARGR